MQTNIYIPTDTYQPIPTLDLIPLERSFQSRFKFRRSRRRRTHRRVLREWPGKSIVAFSNRTIPDTQEENKMKRQHTTLLFKKYSDLYSGVFLFKHAENLKNDGISHRVRNYAREEFRPRISIRDENDATVEGSE